MENEKKPEKALSLSVSIVLSALILAGAWVYDSKVRIPGESLAAQKGGAEAFKQKTALEEEVAPEKGVELPVSWGSLGQKLASAGVIDAEKLRALYEGRGGLTPEQGKMLTGDNSGKIKITKENAAYLLNLFWALGLSNANPVLSDAMEMNNPKYGGAGNFASTGGWTLAAGDPMSHYNRHVFFELTPEQQALVDKVSRGIYRPCCGNSTHFPDCNHGMAMLGILELMASQGANEAEMWQAALAVNSYWFPDTYSVIAQYMESKGVEWKDVSPQEILGFDYSSGPGFAKISAQVTKPSRGGGGSCGV